MRIVQVVLEHYVDDEGADRIVLVGVFEDGMSLPPVPVGRTRNVVSAFQNTVMDTRAFRIHPEK